MNDDQRADIQAELDRLWVAATMSERARGDAHVQQRAQVQVDETALSLARISKIVDDHTPSAVESDTRDP